MKTFLSVLMILAVSMIGCHNDNGTSNNTLPTITGMSPAQVGNGARHVNGTISGMNLSGATAVNLGADVTVESFASVGDTQVSVTFSVSPTAASGARSISVTCAKGTATSASAFTVNIVIAASFTISPATGDTNTTFHLDASASSDTSGKLVEWDWNFGDGNAGSGKTVDHKYAIANLFAVSLHVKDSNGLEAGAHQDLTVKTPINVPPVVCTVPPTTFPNHAHVIGTILSVDHSNFSVVMKIPTKNSCDSMNYRCGNLKDGFFDGQPEHQYGVICHVSFLGDHLFRVDVGHNSGPPANWPPHPPITDAYMAFRTCTEIAKFCSN